MRQEITLTKPNFVCNGWGGPLHRTILGDLFSLSLHKTYVTRPTPLHEKVSANYLSNNLGGRCTGVPDITLAQRLRSASPECRLRTAPKSNPPTPVLGHVDCLAYNLKQGISLVLVVLLCWGQQLQSC